MRKITLLIFICVAGPGFAGCQTGRSGNTNVNVFLLSASEADWIRNGEPIEFEKEKWYPQDGIESLLDSEVYIMGEYRGVQFFVDRTDVRPYNRLYTKFGKNKFRYFKKKDISDDQGQPSQ